MLTCEVCGMSLDDRATACGYCGTAITPSQYNQQVGNFRDGGQRQQQMYQQQMYQQQMYQQQMRQQQMYQQQMRQQQMYQQQLRQRQLMEQQRQRQLQQQQMLYQQQLQQQQLQQQQMQQQQLQQQQLQQQQMQQQMYAQPQQQQMYAQTQQMPDQQAMYAQPQYAQQQSMYGMQQPEPVNEDELELGYGLSLAEMQQLGYETPYSASIMQNTSSGISDSELIGKLTGKIKAYGIMWLVVGIIQLAVGLLFFTYLHDILLLVGFDYGEYFGIISLIGIINIISSIADIKYASNLRSQPKNIIKRFGSYSAHIINLIYNFLVGGGFPAAISIFGLTICAFIRKNEAQFQSIEQQQEFGVWRG